MVVQTGGGATTVQIPVPAELKRHPQWETLVRRGGRVIREGLPAVRFEHFSIVGVDGRGLKEAVVYIVSGGLHSRPQPRMVQQPRPQPRQLQQPRGGAAAAASATSASAYVAAAAAQNGRGTTAASVLADVANADTSGSDNLFPISQQVHVPPPPPPSSPPAKYRKILATTFSTLGVAAIIMSEQAPHASGSRRLAEPNGSVFGGAPGAEPANMLGIYHNVSDDQMLMGRCEWLRLGFRHLNFGHQHRVAFSMLVPMTGHALLVPLGAWFQLAILRDKLGWRTHNMVVRSLHEQIDTALRDGGDDVPSRPPASCVNLFGANVVIGALFALATGAVYKDKWPLVIIAMGIPQFLFAGDVLSLEWSRLRALLVMCAVRIATLVASLEAAAGLVQLAAQLHLGPLPVLGLVCCLDVLLHSTGQGKWRWVGSVTKVAALAASCVCVDVLLTANLGSPSLVASLPLQLFLGMVPAIGAIAAAEAIAKRK